MADRHQKHRCRFCGRYVMWPDRVHDGCGGHNLCPFCGADLPVTYERPYRLAGPRSNYPRRPARV